MSGTLQSKTPPPSRLNLAFQQNNNFNQRSMTPSYNQSYKITTTTTPGHDSVLQQFREKRRRELIIQQGQLKNNQQLGAIDSNVIGPTEAISPNFPNSTSLRKFSAANNYSMSHRTPLSSKRSSRTFHIGQSHEESAMDEKENQVNDSQTSSNSPLSGSYTYQRAHNENNQRDFQGSGLQDRSHFIMTTVKSLTDPERDQLLKMIEERSKNIFEDYSRSIFDTFMKKRNINS